MSFNKLSAFSLASFEMNAQSGGTHRFADAVHGLAEQVSLSPQAMGVIGVPVGHVAFNQPDSEEFDDEDEEGYEDEEEFEDEDYDGEEMRSINEDSVYISPER